MEPLSPVRFSYHHLENLIRLSRIFAVSRMLSVKAVVIFCRPQQTGWFIEPTRPVREEAVVDWNNNELNNSTMDSVRCCLSNDFGESGTQKIDVTV